MKKVKNIKLLYFVVIIFFLGILLFLFSTGYIRFPRPVEMSTDSEGNFVLYVEDASKTISPVDIKIIIDDKVAVDDDFYFSRPFTPKFWPTGEMQAYTFRLEPGNHTIEVISEKGGAQLEREFEIKDKHWALIHYFSNPNHFSFEIQNEPMYFL